MTEPLLRRLHARGERLAVGALPWVAPVYRAMPQVDEVIEFPFQHGGLQFKARRAIAKQVEGRFDAAYVLPNSLKSALLPFLASIPKRVGYLGEARVGPAHAPAEESQEQAAHGGLLLRPQRREGGPGKRQAAAAACASAQVDAALHTRSACKPAATTSSRRARNTARPSAGPPSTSRNWRAARPPGRAARLRQGGCAVRGDRGRGRAGQVHQPRRQDLPAWMPSR